VKGISTMLIDFALALLALLPIAATQSASVHAAPAKAGIPDLDFGTWDEATAARNSAA